MEAAMYVTQVNIPSGDEEEVWGKIVGCLIHVASGAARISLYKEASLRLLVEWPSEVVFQQCELWEVLIRLLDGTIMPVGSQQPPESALKTTWPDQ
jgi:hypothetical protein